MLQFRCCCAIMNTMLIITLFCIFSGCTKQPTKTAVIGKNQEVTEEYKAVRTANEGKPANRMQQVQAEITQANLPVN